MREKRFLTYPLLVNLSDRDLYRLIEDLEKDWILKACSDLESATTQKILKQFTDSSVRNILQDIEKAKGLSKCEIIHAKDQIAAVADRLLVEQEFEDFSLRYSS